VMDYIEGETLENYLDQAGGGLPVEEVVDIGIQLCTVLSYLHTRQPPIIFRDLKPANVMRTPDGELFLIDFGIARLFKPGKARDTVAYGSGEYASPEQYGKGQTTPQSDMYSLGATLHQLLTGDDPAQTPFRFAPLSRAPLPVELGTLVAQMIEMDADKRPASALLVKRRLQEIAVAARKGSSPAASLGIPSNLHPPLPSEAKKPTFEDQQTIWRLRDRAHEYYMAGRYDLVLPVCEQIKAIDPTNANSHHQRGQALSALGRHEEALSAYEQALHFDPEDALCHYNKGGELATLGRSSEALDAYEQSLHFSPELGTYRNYLAWSGKSKVLELLGRAQEAQEARQNAEQSRALRLKKTERPSASTPPSPSPAPQPVAVSPPTAHLHGA